AGRNRRGEGALGRLAVAADGPTPERALGGGRVQPACKRRTVPPRRPVAVRRHLARTVEQDEISFILWQHRQEIGEGGEDRETHAPTVAVLHPEQRHLPDDVGPRDGGGELATHGLGDDVAEVIGEAIRKAMAPWRGRGALN